MPIKPHHKESWVENKAREYAKSLGYLCYKFTSPGNFGVPDRIFINPCGVTIYIEFKAPGKRANLTKHQYMQVRKIHEQQAPVFVVDDLDECKRILDKWHWVDKPSVAG